MNFKSKKLNDIADKLCDELLSAYEASLYSGNYYKVYVYERAGGDISFATHECTDPYTYYPDTEYVYTFHSEELNVINYLDDSFEAEWLEPFWDADERKKAESYYADLYADGDEFCEYPTFAEFIESRITSYEFREIAPKTVYAYEEFMASDVLIDGMYDEIERIAFDFVSDLDIDETEED